MRCIYLLSFFFTFSFGHAQTTTPLPVSLYFTADTARPLIVYISGDGGINKFSQTFLKSFQDNGYAVVAIDARSYFWKRKAPQVAAADVNKLANQYLRDWKRKNFILIGYSFGADVAPFIFNRLSAETISKAQQLVLLSPSSTTDFEIHVSNILGFNKNSGERVPAEINKVSKNVLLIFGSDENDFPLNEVTIKNKQVITLPGGHHYEGDAGALVKQIINRIK